MATKDEGELPFLKRTKGEWEALASKRILSILRQRHLCTQRQLESKISEAGPLGQRPHPLSITDGLNALRYRGLVHPHSLPPPANIEAFALQGFDFSTTPTHKARYDMLMATWPLYNKFAANNDICANSLELVVHHSFEQSSAFELLHSEVTHGIPKTISLGSTTIDNSSPIDHIVRHRATGVLMLVEDKNKRQWFYPDSRGHDDELARTIAKAITNGLTPMLITRKVPFVSHRFFKPLGLLAFQTHHQYFHPWVSHVMRDIKHKDGLGFHDIVFTTDANPQLVQYLDGLSDDILTRYRDTFISHDSIIRKFAIDRSMGFNEFTEALGLSSSKIEEATHEYDYEGPY